MFKKINLTNKNLQHIFTFAQYTYWEGMYFENMLGQ